MSVSWIYHGHDLQQRDIAKHPSPPFHPESPPQEDDHAADHVHEHDGGDGVTEATQRHEGPCFPWGWDHLSQQAPPLPFYENIYALPLDHSKYPFAMYDAHMPEHFIPPGFRPSPEAADGHHVEHHIYSHTTISHSPNVQPVFPFDARVNVMPRMVPEDGSSTSDHMETRAPSPQQYAESSAPVASPPYVMPNVNFSEGPAYADGTTCGSTYTPCGSLYPSPTPAPSAPSPMGSHRSRQSLSPNQIPPPKTNGPSRAAARGSTRESTYASSVGSPAATAIEPPLLHSSPEAGCELAAPQPVKAYKVPKVIRGDKPRGRSDMEICVDFSNPPDLLEPLKDEPSEPPPEDMMPSDPEMVPRLQDVRFDEDLYTPKWVRGHGNKREGWCGICKPGRWLVLKNSAFWYDKCFSHGVSATTGKAFSPPKQVRRTEGSTNIWEGQCAKCDMWVGLVSNKKKGTTWFRHAYKCQTASSTDIKPMEPLKRKRDDGSPGEEQPAERNPRVKSASSKPSKKRPAVPVFSATTDATSEKAPKKTKAVKKGSF